MKFRGAALTLKPAARMDIEIFGLDPTSKFHIPQPDRPLTQIWECHVTYLPKKDRILMCELPLPPAGTGRTDGSSRQTGKVTSPTDRTIFAAMQP